MPNKIPLIIGYCLEVNCIVLFLFLVVFLFLNVGMNIFVAFFVLLLLLADNTPPATPSIPLIGQCLLNILVLRLS